MVLVQREGKLRLLDFRMNPWLALPEEFEEDDDDPNNINIHKGSVFIHSGCVTTYNDFLK